MSAAMSKTVAKEAAARKLGPHHYEMVAAATILGLR
jgi:hypothetical protein